MTSNEIRRWAKRNKPTPEAKRKALEQVRKEEQRLMALYPDKLKETSQPLPEKVQ